MSLAILSHAACSEHDMGPGHPERPARVEAVRQALAGAPFANALEWIDAPRATRAQLERAHPRVYVDALFDASPSHGHVHLDPDTAMGPASLTAALHAAGAVVDAVDRVVTGGSEAAFCNVRPPGHHAERERAMGFCFFNNVAVGAAHALAAHEVERVAIVDFDVHHGNGTEDVFRDEARVLFCSSFQHPFYPYSGADTVSDHILNLPLAAGTKGAAFREAVTRRWLGRLDAFRPQLVMVSAGFDAHAEDLMAQLGLVEDDYAWVSTAIKALADAHADGRIVSTLEGGYALSALGRSVVAHVGALLGS